MMNWELYPRLRKARLRKAQIKVRRARQRNGGRSQVAG